MGRTALVLAGVAAGVAVGVGVTWAAMRPPGRGAASPAGARVAAEADAPASPPPIDAARIQTGRLTFSRMPEEVTTALELHSAEIVKAAEVLHSKQARITGTCAPGSAIRVVGEDGTVVCQKLPKGVVSVSALSGLPRMTGTATVQLSVPGGVGRHQVGGEDDYLVVPVSLPDGAVVTGFSYVFWDSEPSVDGVAYLYRSDDTAMAAVATEGAKEEVRMVTTEEIAARKVDNAGFAYLVYMQTSGAAGAKLMPIAASIAYRLP